MTTESGNIPRQHNRPTEQIHRLAWLIILVSFMLFCSLTLASTGGIYYFFFRSTISMDTTLQVSRGTVPVTTLDSLLVVRSGSAQINLTDRGSIISTDAQSQATLTVEIPMNETVHALATMTLHSNSSITFLNSRRPRFDWSDGYYGVNLADFKGEADILVTQVADDRLFSLRIGTLGKITYLFDTPGRYSIIANDTSIQLISFEGEAILLSSVPEHNRLVSRGEQAILRTGGNLPILSSAPTNLLKNGLFALQVTSTENGELIPQHWACFRAFDAPPSGDWFTDTWQGRPALRLLRSENATTSSRTGCFQIVNLDVSSYSLLELKATFLLNYQSLANCGQEGTECPMMLFVDYVDINGVNRTWTQGIFYNFDPQSPYPLSCQTCGIINEHRQISEKVWYTYESGNLFTRLAPEERPSVIQRIQFYASGHRYDVYVGEMDLFAGTELVVPPAVEPENND